MNNRHRKTLAAVFADPANGNLAWRHIEAPLLALGATKDEGQGSALTLFVHGRRIDLHRPHPNKEALRYRVKAVREFLTNAGIQP